MYGAYSAAAFSLRAKPSFSYSPLPLSSSSSSSDHYYYYYDELALSRNPNLLLLLSAHLLRRPSWIHWSPSRTFLPAPWPTWRWRRLRRCCGCEGFGFGGERSELDEETRVLSARRKGNCSVCGSDWSEETCASESDEGLWRRRGGGEKGDRFRVLDRKGRDGRDCYGEGDRVRRRERRDWDSSDGERVLRRKAKKVVGCSTKCRREDSEEDDDYEERDLLGKRYSGKGSKELQRNSRVHGDERERDSGSIREGSTSRATRHSDVERRCIRRAQWRSEDRDERFLSSIDSDQEVSEDYAEEDERFVRTDSREGSRKVHDYRTRVSSSNVRDEGDATRRADRRVGRTLDEKKISEIDERIQRREEIKRGSQDLKEIREVYDTNIEKVKRDKRSKINQQVIDETDLSISKSEVDATNVDRKVNIALSCKKNSELKKSSQNLRDITMLKNSNFERESHSKGHFEDSSISVRRDEQEQINQQVVSKGVLRRQNKTRTDISRINTSDAKIASNSQSNLQSIVDSREYSTKVANVVLEGIAEQNDEQVTNLSISQRDSERNAQVVDLARTNTDIKSQEVHNMRIENEHAKRQYSFRGESSSTVERDYSSRIENQKDNKFMMVQGEREEQRSKAKGDSRRQVKTQMASTGSVVSASSSKAHEFDSQDNRDEVHFVGNNVLKFGSTPLGKSSALRRSQTAIGVQPSAIDPITKYEGEKYIEASGGRSSSRSGFKGPSDEIWEMRSAASAETFRTARETEENFSSAGTESTRGNPKSLWTFVADIIKLGWIRSNSSSKKAGKRSSSSESLNSPASWFSGEGQDEDGEEMDKKRYSDKGKEPLLIKKPIESVELIEGEHGRGSSISSVITVDRSMAMTDDNTPSAAIIQMKPKEEPVMKEPPEIATISGKEGELKRRKLRRTDQVVKESFDEWEEAYRIDKEQRKMDEFFMAEALVEAQKAADTWEVPVGAVLVRNGEIIARGCNLVEELRDSTAHAEMVCIREASNFLRTWRLSETTLYVTLEPCAMCAGAILQARIDTVVWGAPNKLVGADGSWVRLFPGDDGENNGSDLSNQAAGPVHPFHPKITIRRGVLATECAEAMQQFFQLRRKKLEKKPEPPPPPPPPPPPQSFLPTHPIKFFTKVHGIFSTMFCL